MPYTGITDSSLPPNVRRLSARRRRQWLAVYNSEKAKGTADGEAIHRANGVIMRQLGHSTGIGAGRSDVATMYSGINDPALPANVKSMPAHFRHQWLTVYTAAVKRGTPEEKARNMANGLVKRTMAMTSEVLVAGSEGLELAEDIEFGEEQWVSGSDVEDRQVSQADAQYDPYGASGGQGCASCQWFVSPNACVNVAGDIQPTGKSRLYFPQVQDSGGMGNQFPFNLTDAEGDPVMQGIIDFSGHEVILGEHAIWTTAYQNNLPDSSFAYIEPGGAKDAEGKTTPRSLRHFPYKDGSGKLDETHVRDALGRIPQSNVSAAAKASALRIIRAAAARLGIKVTAAAGGSSVEEPSSGVHGAFQSILGFLGLRDLPAAGGVASRLDGAGDPPNVVFPGRPMLALSEDAKEPGRLRYWAVASNNFMPDNKGLGFPAVAQQEYVDWVWADPERRMAELQLWHTPGTRLGQDDWVDFDGHFLHSTGLIDAGREELAQRYAADPDIAMSHGYVVVWDEHGRAEGFRSYEKSILPRAYAGNSYTGFGLREDTVAFSEPRKSFLREAGLSDSEITAREHRWEQFAQALEGLGVGSHELELYVMSSAAEAASAQPVAGDPATAPAATSAAPVAAATPTETLTLDGIRAMVSSLLEPISGRLGALEQHALSFDAAVANEWTARAQPGGGFRPAADGRTIPGISDNGRTLTQPVAGQQSGETRPLDPRVMRAIAQGAEAGEQAAEASADPLGWIGKKLQANPILTGGPTESRG